MKSSKAPQQNVDEEHGTTQQVVVDGKVSSSDARNITMLQDPSSDYILVSNEPIAAFFHRSWRERYGVHMLIWMCFATCLWGANLIILVAGMEFFPNLKLSGDASMDAAFIICIPFLMILSTAVMWKSYKKKNYVLALALSAIPVVFIVWILIEMGI